MGHQNNNQFHILQYNTGRSIAATSILTSQINSYDLILCQEPYCVRNNPACLPTTCNTLRGTLDYLWALSITPNDNLSLLHHDNISSPYTSCTEIIINNNKYIFINFYSPKDKSVEDITTLIQNSINTFSNVNFIIAGDALDHCTRQWEDFFARNGLVVINDPHSPPTFVSTQGHSWIDITACSLNCVTYISDWRVLEDSLDDHAMISFNINTTTNNNFKQPHLKFNLKHVDWYNLKKHLDNNLINCEHPNQQTTRECIEKNICTIETACHDFIPKYTNNRKPVPWWNDTLKLLRQENIRLRKKFQNCHHEPKRINLKTEYLQKLKNYKKEIKNAKQASWTQFCETATKNP
ncbi:uncharacterized protein [Centruroides vittatus]|uniref:uncharacterized protein n=1 Tax=Centruroides vittatus TaxID=120091 RepID=UPI00351064B6